MADLLTELEHLDEHLRRQGSSVAHVIEHMAKQTLGANAAPPLPAEPPDDDQ